MPEAFDEVLEDGEYKTKKQRARWFPQSASVRLLPVPVLHSSNSCFHEAARLLDMILHDCLHAGEGARAPLLRAANVSALHPLLDLLQRKPEVINKGLSACGRRVTQRVREQEGRVLPAK